jgi:hypothetical protein
MLKSRINEIEDKRKSVKQRFFFFFNIYKSDKPLTRLIKKKVDTSYHIRSEKANAIPDPTKIKSTVKEPK